MKILANENVYEPMVEFLVAQGHDVINTKRTELAGAPDELVYRRAIAENRVIVTMDKDFTRMLRFPPQQCGGIIVVKLYRMTVDDATLMFVRHFSSLSEQVIQGNLIIMPPDHVRVRKTLRQI